MSGLLAEKRYSQYALRSRTQYLAAIAEDTRRNIHRNARHATRVDRLDNSQRRTIQRTRQPGTEQTIDNEFGARQDRSR